METIAVTGHTGFIGKHLVNELECRHYNVIKISKEFESVECDRVYHLACPSTTTWSYTRTLEQADIIIDGTRKALTICPTALFVNASSMGALYIEDTPQGMYNVAKRCMEIYIQHSNINYLNYRIPSVYGIGMHNDNFIKKCIDKVAYLPEDPNREYYIAHISEVIDALIELRPIKIEETTLGQIYELFNSGRRGLYRPTSD